MPEYIESEEKEKREEAIADRLVVRRNTYRLAIQAAVNFSLAAPADPNLLPWRQWGARNIGGRVRSIVQHPENPSVFYAGSAQGGVFRSADGGDTWQPVGLPQDSFPVGAMAIAPSRPSVIYVGTGEAGILHDQPNGANMDARETFAAGLGFFRYDEITKLFVNEIVSAVQPPPPPPPPPLPIVAANSFARIVVDPRNHDRCWMATHRGLFRRERGPAFFREAVPPPPAALPNAPAPGACVTDVVLAENWSSDPNQANTYRIYAALGSVGIFRGVFTPNPAPNIVWDPMLTNGLPVPNAPGAPTIDRIRLAVCASFPNHVYAVMEDAARQQQQTRTILGVFYSSNGGDTWNPCGALPDLGGQAWVNLAIAVHPDSPGVLVVCGMESARSLDFGATWERLIDWQNFFGEDLAQHPDQHDVIFDRIERNRIWIGNDGGISSAPDVVNANPRTDRTWRKRSHGLCISQFNDITSSPTYPFMLGGGLQDNSTYVTFGGPTWYEVSVGDGGQMCFEVQNPRTFLAPSQGAVFQTQLVPSGFILPPLPVPPPVALASDQILTHSVILADQPGPPNDDFAVFHSAVFNRLIPAANGPLFVPIIGKHRQTAGHVLVGRMSDVFATANFGTAYTAGGVPGLAGNEEVSAVAYGVTGAAPAADWWVGTSRGRLFLGTNAAPPKAWANVTPPGLGNARITSIAAHPNNNNYIVIATTGVAGAASAQGRVFLSNNHGANWLEITGLTAAFQLPGAAPVVAPPGPNSLPPCPITSLAFDPTVPAGNPQTLYAGTLGGVYVIRNLPPLPVGPPPPIVVPAAFNPIWNTFNGPAGAPLPLTLVNDLEIVVLPPRPGAVANTLDSVSQVRLYAAMFGRGIFACDITSRAALPAALLPGGPRVRLYTRQHVIEDGLAYPRPTPAVLNTAPTAAASYIQPEMQGDPRRPVGAINFDDITGYDIRVDNEPFQFFDEVLDGVEFDTELKTKNLVPGQLNAVYVQVHTAGWDRADAVNMHLFFAQAPAPAAGPDPNPLPDLQADFWPHFTEKPALAAPAAAPAAPRAFWQRVGPKKVIPATRLTPTSPVVLRFEWVPPSTLGGGFVGLLAVCTSAADPLPAVAAISTNLRALIRAERRVAFRLVPSSAYVPDVYIRDTLEDDGRPGAGGAAGRSPDIIVVQSPAADPNTEFRDLLDSHAGDRIRVGVDQTIYVRVHNRRAVPVQADVEVLWAKPNAAVATPDAHAPTFDGTTWTRIAPAGIANVTVPANGWALAQLTWAKADVPAIDTSEGAFNAVALIALVSSTEGAQDVKPVVARVRDAASFWQFFGRLADSNNAAMRALLIEP